MQEGKRRWWRWPQLFQRKVAASAYVAGMLTFAFLAIPSQWYEGVGARVAFGAVAVLCAFGSIYEWWWRKDDILPLQSGTTPPPLPDPTPASVSAKDRPGWLTIRHPVENPFARTENWSTRLLREADERKVSRLRREAAELDVAEKKERLQQARLDSGEQAVRQLMADAERHYPTQPKPELVVGHDRMRGFDHSLVTAPGLNDPRWNMRPFYIRNDGKATALNITVDGEMVGSRSISFGLESTSVKESGEISLSIYRNHDRIDTHIESVFTELIEQKIKSGATERIEERLSVRVKYKDRLLSEYSDRYDIIVAAHPREGGGWQMEPMRVDLVLEEL